MAFPGTECARGLSGDGIPLDWSPDGTRIAFVRDGYLALGVIEVATGEVRTLLSDLGGARCRRLSTVSWRQGPGDLLLSAYDPSEGSWAGLYRVDPDTGTVRLLCEGAALPNLDADFAPGGERLVVTRQVSRAHERAVCLVDAEGRLLRELVGLDCVHRNPRWSADGQMLVLSGGATPLHGHIWRMDTDGRGRQQLTRGDACDAQPDVRPAVPPL
jgi:Tol biopolymer transport system component